MEGAPGSFYARHGAARGWAMRHDNCFNDVRLLAALAVIVSHAFMLTAGSNQDEPVFRISHGQVTGGGLAVFAFFAISGYLIARSFDRTRSIRVFIAARVARIVPGLALVLAVTAFLLGPMLTPLPVAEYFAGYAPLLYVVRNLSLVVYAEGLPGVLPRNPLPGVMNGSLWTLHIEAACYALVLALGAVRMLNRASTAGLVLAGGAAMAWMPGISYPVVLITHFMAGAAVYHWRIPRHAGLAAVCAAALVVALVAGGFVIVSAMAGAVAICHLGRAPAWRGRTLTGTSDLSYGVYIWAFPVQQTVQHLGEQLGRGGMRWYANTALSLPVILALAWLSWHLVEKRALSWKPALSLAARHADAGDAPELPRNVLRPRFSLHSMRM